MNSENGQPLTIRPYGRNAKKHPDKQLEALAKIVKEVGWRQPVIVNQEGVIVVGHGRWFTFQRFRHEYGLKEIWVMDDAGNTVMGRPETMPLTPEQEATYRLADNKLSESEWDMGLVLQEIKDLDLEGVDIDLTGFDSSLMLQPADSSGSDENENKGSGKKPVECPECGCEFVPE